MMHHTTLQTYEQSQTGHWEMKTVLHEKQGLVHGCRAILSHEFVKGTNCSLNKKGKQVYNSTIKTLWNRPFSCGTVLLIIWSLTCLLLTWNFPLYFSVYSSVCAPWPPDATFQMLPPYWMMWQPLFFPHSRVLTQALPPTHTSFSSLSPYSFSNPECGRRDKLESDGHPLPNCCLRVILCAVYDSIGPKKTMIGANCNFYMTIIFVLFFWPWHLFHCSLH